MPEELKQEFKRTNWKQWKRGLLVAAITGFVTALAAIAIFPNIDWKKFLLVLGGSLGKDMLLYLQKHPVESIEDTVIIEKKDL